VPDQGTAAEPEEPDIAAGAHVVDKDGHRVGDVESVELDEASGRITRIVVRRGFVFGTETVIPASLIASIADRITLNVGAEVVKRLERT
jgi:sporulation protein YlmC with PRC-barrel domain